jgi:single-strand DNA-binding protein
MGTVNKVIFVGRLTRDPESRTFQNGGKVTSFGFAVDGSRRKNQQTGQWESEPCFIDVKCYDSEKGKKLATLAEGSLAKGREVFLEGHLVLEKWQSQDGGNRQKHVLVVDNITFVGPRPENAPAGSSAVRPQNSGRPARPESAPEFDAPPPIDEEEIPF